MQRLDPNFCPYGGAPLGLSLANPHLAVVLHSLVKCLARQKVPTIDNGKMANPNNLHSET